MVRTESTMLQLGTSAPDFRLLNTNTAYGGEEVSLADLKEKSAILVIFMCNHCPFVIHVRDELVKFVAQYQPKGLVVVAISANDATTHPADSPTEMARAADEFGFTFPYLYDENQEVAKAYQAACTPDFFLFDGQLKLAYRGQFDDARPSNQIPVTGKDLRAAVDAVLAGEAVHVEQKPSIGCNIKWKPGQEPDYFAAASR